MRLLIVAVPIRWVTIPPMATKARDVSHQRTGIVQLPASIGETEDVLHGVVWIKSIVVLAIHIAERSCEVIAWNGRAASFQLNRIVSILVVIAEMTSGSAVR